MLLQMTRKLALLAALGLVTLLDAETLVETSNEARFQIDFKVPAAALAAYLPPGWTSSPAAEGAAKV